MFFISSNFTTVNYKVKSKRIAFHLENQHKRKETWNVEPTWARGQQTFSFAVLVRFVQRLRKEGKVESRLDKFECYSQLKLKTIFENKQRYARQCWS